jgi:hypothetical protein
MNLSLFLCVPILLGFAIFFAVRREEWAGILYRYYNSRPEPEWRPKWLPWAFRPTHRQAAVLSWLAIFFFGVLALVCAVLAFV